MVFGFTNWCVQFEHINNGRQLVIRKGNIVVKLNVRHENPVMDKVVICKMFGFSNGIRTLYWSSFASLIQVTDHLVPTCVHASIVQRADSTSHSKLATILLTRLPCLECRPKYLCDCWTNFQDVAIRLQKKKSPVQTKRINWRRQPWMKQRSISVSICRYPSHYLHLVNACRISFAPLTLTLFKFIEKFAWPEGSCNSRNWLFRFQVVVGEMIVNANSATLIKVSVYPHQPTTVYKLKTLKIINFKPRM